MRDRGGPYPPTTYTRRPNINFKYYIILIAMYQIRLVFNANIIAKVYSYILTRQTDNLNKQKKIVCSNICLLSIHRYNTMSNLCSHGGEGGDCFCEINYSMLRYKKTFSPAAISKCLTIRAQESTEKLPPQVVMTSLAYKT